MWTYRHLFKQILGSLLFIAICSGYHPAMAETTSDSEAHHAQHSQDWPGIYQGFLPCADCTGVKTTLALNKNNSYMLISQFIGKSEREFVEKGKFTWGDKTNTIVLTPKNSSTTQQYLVAENALIQLDSKGNQYSGKLLDRYTLRRTNIIDNPPSHSSH